MKHLLEKVVKITQRGTSEGVILLADYNSTNTHEELYLKVRTKENRLLNDDAVRKLPFVARGLPHYKEWKLRKQTIEQFYKYLAEQDKTFQILDLGCGNGWFSAKIAEIKGIEVVGLDLNLPELQQANRLFSNNDLSFCYGNIIDMPFYDRSFDLVILNASIQYFPSVNQLVNLLLRILRPNGEIHILDSPFYEIDEVVSARKRTVDYYTSIGFPEMSNYYFHHSTKGLALFSPNYKKKERRFLDTLLRKQQNPFPWIIITKREL